MQATATRTGIDGAADRVAAMVRVEGPGTRPRGAAHGAVHGFAQLREISHAGPLGGRNRLRSAATGQGSRAKRSSRAPKMLGGGFRSALAVCAPPRSCARVITGRQSAMARSSRSARAMTAPMPLSTTGLCASMMCSSPLVVELPPRLAAAGSDGAQGIRQFRGDAGDVSRGRRGGCCRRRHRHPRTPLGRPRSIDLVGVDEGAQGLLRRALGAALLADQFQDRDRGVSER
jgi:hypothetical protein